MRALHRMLAKLPLAPLSLVLLLAGCGASSLDKDATFSPADDAGMVVIGYLPSYGTDKGFGQVNFARYDVETKKVTGISYMGKMVGMLSDDAIVLTDKWRSARFRAYKMAPGEYVLAHADLVYGTNAMRTTFYIDTDSKTLRDNSPVFTVKRGEIVYIGDVAMDFGRFPAGLAIKSDVGRAAQFVKTMPGVTNQTMTFRPLRSFVLPAAGKQ